MRRTVRGDRILEFIENYPEGILSFNKVEKLAGITPGRLSHYKYGRKNCSLGHRSLCKLEQALVPFGFQFDPLIDNLMELKRRQDRGMADTQGIDEGVLEQLKEKRWIKATGEITPSGFRKLGVK